MFHTRRSFVPLLVLVILMQNGCYITRGALLQERSRLQAEFNALTTLEGALQDPNYPGGGKHVVLKLGFDAINQVLAGADALEMPLPESRDTVLRIHSIRMTGHDATPLVNVQASAQKYGVTVEVAVTAMMLIDYSNPQQPMFRVRIQDIAPVIKWRWFSIRKWELARKVLVTEADKLAVNQLVFPIPMQHALQLNIPEVAQRTDVPTRPNGSWIRYSVRKPASTLNRVVKIDRIEFLMDGIYLYATVA